MGKKKKKKKNRRRHYLYSLLTLFKYGAVNQYETFM